MTVPNRVYRREPWQRFTLLDMLLVQASFGLGFSLAFAPGGEDLGRMERVIAGVVLGFVSSGPIVLLTHWAVRDRSRALSLGEWLWLSPTVLTSILWCSLKMPAEWYPQVGSRLFVVWILAQAACFGAAIATLASGARGYRSTVPCYWTDRWGTWASLLFGAWAFATVLPAVL
ncbi:MAG: hypothetical protein ACYTG0_00405 [Planctomycetota bacterium]|jgi:hypothetical protein